jgi:hypothetical protein
MELAEVLSRMRRASSSPPSRSRASPSGSSKQGMIGAPVIMVMAAHVIQVDAHDSSTTSWSTA